MTISKITLLLTDNPYAVAVDFVVANNPIPVRLNVIEPDVATVISIVSNDFVIVVNVLLF